MTLSASARQTCKLDRGRMARMACGAIADRSVLVRLADAMTTGASAFGCRRAFERR